MRKRCANHSQNQKKSNFVSLLMSVGWGRTSGDGSWTWGSLGSSWTWIGRATTINSSAIRWKIEIVDVIFGVHTQSTRCECLVDSASMSTFIPLAVRLNPGISSLNHCGIAWLQKQTIHEQMQPDDVSFAACRICSCVCGPTTRSSSIICWTGVLCELTTEWQVRRRHCEAYLPRSPRCLLDIMSKSSKVDTLGDIPWTSLSFLTSLYFSGLVVLGSGSDMSQLISVQSRESIRTCLWNMDIFSNPWDRWWSISRW